MADFLQELSRRVLVYDGAMGTNVHKHNLTLDDYWGHENLNDILVLSRPDVIRSIHASFLEVGCDVIETDTFNGSPLDLEEFGLEDISVSRSACRVRGWGIPSPATPTRSSRCA